MSDRNFFDDDFSDIENMIPKKHITPVRLRNADTSAVYLEFGEDRSSAGINLSPPAARGAATKEFTYEPESGLIKLITVRPRLSPARFYADFVADARKYLNMHGKECAPMPFPAYIPEYRSMKKAQLDYYLYFRDAVKDGKRLDTPQSYILLLLFEIINLPKEIKPADGASLMHRLWKMYRQDYPRLDTYIPQWLCDYLMIHRIPLPGVALSDAAQLAGLSDFPEFYLSSANCDRYTLLCKTAGYTPDSDGKYPETHKYLKKHIVSAIDCISYKKFGRRFSPEDYLTLTTGARTAYRSALCACDNNALISYTYRSFSKRTVSVQNLAECIRYAENRIRAYLSIRSRLKCTGLDLYEKSIIDEYFDEHLPIVRKRYTPITEASYSGENDFLYEPKSYGISFEAAKTIEKDSWKATAMLEDAFTFEEAFEAVPEPSVTEITHDHSGALGALELEFLQLLFEDKGADATAFARDKGIMPEALAEKINVYAFDILGDSVIENTDGTLAVIEDYKEDIKEWLSN